VKEYLAESHIRRFDELAMAGGEVRTLVDNPRLGLREGDTLKILVAASRRGARFRGNGVTIRSSFRHEGKFWEVVE
jgi:hypothetical protein